MKSCLYCGAPLDSDALFCQNCGKKIEPQGKLCPRCGAEVDVSSSFCIKCGIKLNGWGKTSAVPTKEELQKYDLEDEKVRTWWYAIGAVVVAFLAFGSYYAYKHNNNNKRQKEAEKIAEAYCKKIDEFFGGFGSDDPFCEYFLFDITHDGIPELWIRSGPNYIKTQLDVFTFNNGILHIYREDAGHTAHYDYLQGQDYILGLFMSMGYVCLDKITYDEKDGLIKSERIFNGDECSQDYTAPKEPIVETYNYDNKQPIFDWLNAYTHNKKSIGIPSEAKNPKSKPMDAEYIDEPGMWEYVDASTEEVSTVDSYDESFYIDLSRDDITEEGVEENDDNLNRLKSNSEGRQKPESPDSSLLLIDINEESKDSL